MKKLLLSALLAAGAMTAMSAQDLQFLSHEGDILNGQTFSYEGYETYPQGSKTEVFIDPDLYILSEKGGEVNVKVVSNIPIQLCLGGGCEEGLEPIKENVTLEAGKKTSLLLDYSEYVADMDNYDLPSIICEVTAWYSSDPSTVITMTVKMGSAAGVEGIMGSLNNVNFNGNVLNYDLAQASRLSVYSLSGKQVMAKEVSGNGSVSLSNLPKGVYLYRVAGKNGKAVKASKIIIK